MNSCTICGLKTPNENATCDNCQVLYNTVLSQESVRLEEKQGSTHVTSKKSQIARKIPILFIGLVLILGIFVFFNSLDHL